MTDQAVADDDSDTFLLGPTSTEKRLQICEACEFYGVDLPAFKKYANKMCKKCLCYMPSKARIKISTCPEGKW